MTVKAIETSYKGYRFRSRLEARWAVFFDAMGVKWQYELEGYQAGSISYLPDFQVGAMMSMVVRISALPGLLDRGMPPSEVEEAIARAREWDMEDGMGLLAAPSVGTVLWDVKPASSLPHDQAEKLLKFARNSEAMMVASKGDPVDMDLMSFSYAPEGGLCMSRAAVIAAPEGVLHLLQTGIGCGPDDFRRVASLFDFNNIDARNAARAARFEHGETPK